MADDDVLVLSRFAGRIGETFRLIDVEPPLEFELLEAEPLRVRPEGADPELQFALLFAGPAERPLEQQTLRLLHPALGDVVLFVVPVAEHGGVRHYEAIVNRMR